MMFKLSVKQIFLMRKQSEWTIKVLHAIPENQHLPLELQSLPDLRKKGSTLNIRKLKSLGVSISHTQVTRFRFWEGYF